MRQIPAKPTCLTKIWLSKECLSVSRISFAALLIIKIYCNSVMGGRNGTVFPCHGTKQLLSRISRFYILRWKDFWDNVTELQTGTYSTILSILNTRKHMLVLWTHREGAGRTPRSQEQWWSRGQVCPWWSRGTLLSCVMFHIFNKENLCM